LLSTTKNFLWAIFYAFRATQASNYDPRRDDNTVYIYFISNDIEDRTPKTQLDLQLPSIRSQYLNIWELNHDYVEHEVYRKERWGRRWDYSKENGEVLVRKEIPSRRVVGRCRYVDLEDCRMNWWLDKVTGASTQGNKILPKYQEAMRQLKLEKAIPLFKNVAASAREMCSVCLGRDGIARVVAEGTLFDILIYGLTGKELKAAVPIRLSAKEIGYAISSETEIMSRDGEMVTTSAPEMVEYMKEKGDQNDEN